MDTWKTTSRATKIIAAFRRRCLRRVVDISWRDHITNDEVMTWSGQMALHDTVVARRRLVGHIL